MYNMVCLLEDNSCNISVFCNSKTVRLILNKSVYLFDGGDVVAILIVVSNWFHWNTSS